MAIPTPYVKVDWANNGNYTGTYDDITADVLGFTWHRGGSDWSGGTQVGGATIRVKNYAGKYTPLNSGGVLYGYLLPGRPVHITAVYSGTTYGIFGGFVDRIIPVLEGGRREVELICSDAFTRMARRRYYLDADGDDINSVYDVRDTIIGVRFNGEIVSDYTASVVEQTFGLVGHGMANRGAVELLEQLNSAVGSRHSIRPIDNPVGSTGWEYWVAPRTHKLSDTVDETITNVQSISGYEVTADNVLNAPTATYVVPPQRDPLADRVTVWDSGVMAIVIESAATRTWSPTLDAEYVDYQATVTSSGGTATTTVMSCGPMVRVKVAASISAVTVRQIVVTAAPTVTASPVEVSASDSTSITAYGEQGSGVTSSFLHSDTAARAICDYLLWRFKDPRARPTIRIVDLFPTVLARELYDVIALTLTSLSLSARRFEVVGLQGAMAPGGSWSVDYTLQEMTEQGSLTTWFLLGTSSLGGAAKLAP